MKNVLCIFLFLFIGQNATCQLKKVALDSIGKAIIERTQTFAFKTYQAHNQKSLPKLSNSIATKRLREHYKYTIFSEQRSAIADYFGSLQKVELIEVLKTDKRDFIFRFKAYYTMTDYIPEIRVYLDSEYKIDGIIFKSVWFDKYYTQNQMPPLNKIEVDSIHQANAFEFANKTFKECSKNNFLELTTDNALAGFAKTLSTEKLQSSCEKLTQEFGEVIDFRLVEILSDNYRIIYRYKANYTKAKDFLEFRVYTNMEHKFVAIWCEDKWFDTFYEINKTPKNASK